MCWNCRISDIVYVQAIKVEFEKVVKLQEELGIDVLVHGEAEVKNLYLKYSTLYRPDMF